MKKYLSAITLFCAFGCLVPGVSAQDRSVKVKADDQTTDTRGYQLGAGDEVNILVMSEPDFSGKFIVDEDGQIQLPFVDKPVRASCRTERELRAEVTTLLKKYLREPQVNVQVTQKHSRPPAMIFGEVKAPQQFDMRRNVRLLELLSYTGGTTDKASGLVEVTHTRAQQCAEPDGKFESQAATEDPTKIPSQVYRLSDIRDGKTEANPIVYPGDVINVLSSSPVYVIGEVRAPNQYTIPERGLTLTDAIAMAYGLNERAKKKEIRIYRLKPGSAEREMLSFNLDLIKKGKQSNVLLKPFDIVEVEKAPKTFLQTFKEIATGVVSSVSNTLPTRILY